MLSNIQSLESTNEDPQKKKKRGWRDFVAAVTPPYVADNAQNDPKAPSYCFGFFRGYLAFDTGQPFHYRVSLSPGLISTKGPP